MLTQIFNPSFSQGFSPISTKRDPIFDFLKRHDVLAFGHSLFLFSLTIVVYLKIVCHYLLLPAIRVGEKENRAKAARW
jgi:hypothetical protein